MSDNFSTVREAWDWTDQEFHWADGRRVEPMCGRVGRDNREPVPSLFTCTRIAGHRDVHAAGDGNHVVAVWDQVERASYPKPRRW